MSACISSHGEYDALDPDRGKGTYPSGSQADEMARAIDRLTAERDEEITTLGFDELVFTDHLDQQCLRAELHIRRLG